ncbi:Uncharacterised protein [Legionella wadsworthii]|uniref:Uncharacterized protein n=1 Tax=Legionella wadsworthii TaxID=28088 RepID=A0A378LUL2_9GAMM|nr:hypothetical protein [Legionella wadsworthii]STY31370.1 Uncharacterised protein [Legionella wadsworthii]
MTMDPVVFRTLLSQLKKKFDGMKIIGDAFFLNQMNQTNMENEQDVEELNQLWDTYEAFYNDYIDLVQTTLPMEDLAPPQSRELDAYCNEVMDHCATMRKSVQPFVDRFQKNQQTRLGFIFSSDNSYPFFQSHNPVTSEDPGCQNTTQNTLH